MSLHSVAILARAGPIGALTNSLQTHRSVAARRHEKDSLHETELLHW